MSKEKQEVLVCCKRGGTSPIGYRRIDVTSHANDVFRSCSPFFVGPVSLYDGHMAKNVENAWQYSKVYREFLDDQGDPSPAYFEWAERGWDDFIAHRRPMGHKVPAYSFWDGQKLDYISARKRIYIPLYSKAVVKTEGYQALKQLYDAGEPLCLLDFDAYDYKTLGYSADDVINEPTRSMGHSFVLKFLLEGTIQKPRPFRVIVAGSRGFNDYPLLLKTLDSVLRNKVRDRIEIVSGTAKGADTLGERYAKERGYAVKQFPAAWDLLGKRAGYVRNTQMAQYADALVAFWDGQSPGTKHMIMEAKASGLQIRIKKFVKE